MPAYATAPLAGAARIYGMAAGQLRMHLLSGRSVTPGLLVGNVSDLTADLAPGIAPAVVQGWGATVNTTANPPRAVPTFTTTVFPTVPPSAGPITGAAISVVTTGELVYHALVDELEEEPTTGTDVLVEAGSDGLLHVTSEVT
jgi:hypothetical protein